LLVGVVVLAVVNDKFIFSFLVIALPEKVFPEPVSVPQKSINCMFDGISILVEPLISYIFEVELNDTEAKYFIECCMDELLSCGDK
jgi:hypothetical protein